MGLGAQKKKSPEISTAFSYHCPILACPLSTQLRTFVQIVRITEQGNTLRLGRAFSL
jgi:hypothetical protein